jgi:hypothetical protein
MQSHPAYPHDYRQESSLFTLNGLSIRVRGHTHEVDSIVDIKDVSKGYKFKLEMCCDCCKSRTVWYSSDAIFDMGN